MSVKETTLTSVPAVATTSAITTTIPFTEGNFPYFLLAGQKGFKFGVRTHTYEYSNITKGKVYKVVKISNNKMDFSDDTGEACQMPVGAALHGKWEAIIGEVFPSLEELAFEYNVSLEERILKNYATLMQGWDNNRARCLFRKGDLVTQKEGFVTMDIQQQVEPVFVFFEYLEVPERIGDPNNLTLTDGDYYDCKVMVMRKADGDSTLTRACSYKLKDYIRPEKPQSKARKLSKLRAKTKE